jgi:hypothetical protein
MEQRGAPREELAARQKGGAGHGEERNRAPCCWRGESREEEAAARRGALAGRFFCAMYREEESCACGGEEEEGCGGWKFLRGGSAKMPPFARRGLLFIEGALGLGFSHGPIGPGWNGLGPKHVLGPR